MSLQNSLNFNSSFLLFRSFVVIIFMDKCWSLFFMSIGLNLFYVCTLRDRRISYQTFFAYVLYAL